MGRICITIPDSIEERMDKESDQNAISKSAWVTQGLEQYLIKRDQKPDQMSDPERIALQQRIDGLTDDLSWVRGQLVETQRNLSTALERIPAPMITDGQHKPWWQFWK
jgi:hypothetical protein